MENLIRVGPDAALRLLAPEDVTPAYVEGLNDAEVNRFLVGPRSARQTRDTVEAYVRSNQDDPASLFYGLFVAGELRGTVRLHDIRAGDHAFIGAAIFDKSLWGHGMGTRIIGAATRFATGELGLQRVLAVIEEDNVPSQKAFRRAGYRRVPEEDVVKEGALRQMWVYTPEPDVSEPVESMEETE